MIRGLVFDFDGLILDTESALIRAYADVHASHGVPFDEATFLRSVGHADYSFDPWHAFGKRADRVTLETERRRRNVERNLQLPILPGVVPLLDAARDAGLPVALASNSQHEHCDGHLARLGLIDRFSFLACREDVASPKPEPDLYKLVLNHLGLRGREMIAFEDSHTGTLAAKRAGLWCVAAPNVSTLHHDFRHVDLKVASLAECALPDLVARFGA
ncbi:MAG TPA: HAD family phosphatase [Opitutaceae bacterium]|nr:HAD family phosphatase [Opitutaceae bacterium]